MKFYGNFIYLLLLLLVNLVHGADINIQLSQKSIDDNIFISIKNKSAQPLKLAKVRLKLDNKIYQLSAQEILPANKTKQYKFVIPYPQYPGSYAQIASIYYYNEGRLFSLSDVGYFNYKATHLYAISANLVSKQRGKQSFLNLSAKNPHSWSLVFPDEVSLDILAADKQVSQLENKSWKKTSFLLTGNYTGFNSNYPVFAIKEGLVNERHYAKIISSVVAIKHDKLNILSTYERGKTPDFLLLIIGTLSVIIFLVPFYQKNYQQSYQKNKYKPSAINILLLFSSRLFFLSLSYLILKNINEWLSFSELLSEHFSGKNYRYFFIYFIDIYYWSFIILYLPYLKYFKSTLAINDDKYIAALLSLLKPIVKPILKKVLTPYKPSKNLLQSPTKTGWLIVAVKLFFLPLLASWVIGNIIHQYNLLQNFSWSFYKINAFILALLILVDTSIFLFGYLFESEKLGSKIRSVEPTIFGWIVCLWCYPPFNSFSFAPFDVDLISIHIPIEAWAQPIVLVLITLLWGVFVWASITIGFKASNLTNRGIVTKGPYSYCRHPAYTAKVLVWLVEAVFLGQYFIGLFISFLIIYLLRALTEERHLSMDKDYLDYKKKVPYRFIPRVL